MDETGISTVQEPNKVLAKTGQKRIGTITSWERGKTITVVCAMNAIGTFVPPLFIFPRQRHSPLLEKDGPPGAIYDCSTNGWTNETLFVKWLQHFKNFVKLSEDNKVLLIMDNHNNHSTLEAYYFCKENHITMLSIPPHSSHRLQPLDVTVFGPLKKAYNRECDVFLKSKNLVKITPYEVAGLFKNAYGKVASVDKSINGFRATGISPINPNIFSDEDFLATDTVATDVVNEDSPNDEENLQTSRDTSTTIQSTATQEYLADPSQDMDTHNETSAINVSFTDLSSVLTIISPNPSTLRSSRKSTNKLHSEIITATPNKTVLEEKKRKRLIKENKAPKGKGKKSKMENKKKLNKRVTNYLFRDESSSSDKNIICGKKTNNDNDKENICSFCAETGKSNELWYRCRSCGNWVHAECSGYDSAAEYVCDVCRQH